MDVQAYLQRMNYSGSLEPNLENLRALALAHKMNVPFSNLDFFGGEKSSLVLEEIYQKVVVKGQTGICCELSGLFMWLLDQLGYATSATNARYYYEEQQAWMEGCNHLMPFVHVNGKRYIVDPGFHLVGPIEVSHMAVHVDPYNIHRVRKVPGKDETLFHLERHRKTVLNKDGKILKQGPAPPGVVSGRCDEECCKEESSHWVPLFEFSFKPMLLQDFQYAVDYFHNAKNGNAMMINIIAHVFDLKGIRMSFGDSYAIKECVDPLTDKILFSRKYESDDDVRAVGHDVFKIKVDHPIKFFEKT